MLLVFNRRTQAQTVAFGRLHWVRFIKCLESKLDTIGCDQTKSAQTCLSCTGSWQTPSKSTWPFLAAMIYVVWFAIWKWKPYIKTVMPQLISPYNFGFTKTQSPVLSYSRIKLLLLICWLKNARVLVKNDQKWLARCLTEIIQCPLKESSPTPRVSVIYRSSLTNLAQKRGPQSLFMGEMIILSILTVTPTPLLMNGTLTGRVSITRSTLFLPCR